MLNSTTQEESEDNVDSKSHRKAQQKGQGMSKGGLGFLRNLGVIVTVRIGVGVCTITVVCFFLASSLLLRRRRVGDTVWCILLPRGSGSRVSARAAADVVRVVAVGAVERLRVERVGVSAGSSFLGLMGRLDLSTGLYRRSFFVVGVGVEEEEVDGAGLLERSSSSDSPL